MARPKNYQTLVDENATLRIARDNVERRIEIAEKNYRETLIMVQGLRDRIAEVSAERNAACDDARALRKQNNLYVGLLEKLVK